MEERRNGVLTADIRRRGGMEDLQLM